MRVALTIDTEFGGLPAVQDNPVRLLDILSERSVRATFFVQGRWAGAHPDLTRRIRDDGHLIGNHSYYHTPATMLTPSGLRTTVARAHEVITSVSGVDPRPWFRCPNGDGAGDPAVLAVLRELGYRHVGWDVEPRDWADRRGGDWPAAVAESTVEGCRRHGDGARVLLHSWPDVTVAALPAIVERLAAAGARFVGVDELEGALGGSTIPTAGLTIGDLRECPDALPALAGWFSLAWGDGTPERSAASYAAQLEACLGDDALPVCLVGLLGDEPVATATLKFREIEYAADADFWIGWVCVRHDMRGRGLGRALVEAVEAVATGRGLSPLYLHTPEKETFYAHLGWTTLERAIADGGPTTVMTKTVAPLDGTPSRTSAG